MCYNVKIEHLGGIMVVLIIFLIASVVLFIIGIGIIFLKKDRSIGGISLVGSVIYFVLFLLILNSNFEIDKINRQVTSKTSGSNVSASGDVVAIKPSSITPSRYEDIPVTPVGKVPIQPITVIPVAAVNVTPVTPLTNNNAVATDEKQYVDANGKGMIIGDTDSKIYHMPVNGQYNKTEMKNTTNNVYFKTTKEAEASGYIASKS